MTLETLMLGLQLASCFANAYIYLKTAIECGLNQILSLVRLRNIYNALIGGVVIQCALELSATNLISKNDSAAI